MRKLFLATLIALASSTLFAMPMKTTITAANLLPSMQAGVVNWTLNGASDLVTVQNSSSTTLTMLVHVSHYASLLGSAAGYLADPAIVTCGNRTLAVNAGSSAVCEIPAWSSLQLQIDPFKLLHGSRGTYTILN
jgi:hypothetical protein